MELIDRITINLKGIGITTATAVKTEEGKTWYVFDGTIGNSTMNNIDNFLSDLATKFPESLRERLDEIRLLDASEVFSDCDLPDEWEWLLRNMDIKMENPQLPYFKSIYHRMVKYQLNGATAYWRLHSIGPRMTSAGVGIHGGSCCLDIARPDGVRPLFILKDMED